MVAKATAGGSFRGVFLVCADLARSVEFYQTLGLTVRQSSTRSAKLSLGEMQLHLHESLTTEEEMRYGVRWQQGTTGMVLLFSSQDLDELWQHAPDGAKLVPPRATPWGDRIAMLQDPDGYRLEFCQETP